jgi:hypothetical protein
MKHALRSVILLTAGVAPRDWVLHDARHLDPIARQLSVSHRDR